MNNHFLHSTLRYVATAPGRCFVLVNVVVGVLLASCQPVVSPSPVTPQPPPSEIAIATPSLIAGSPIPNANPLELRIANGCRAYSPRPTPGATEQSLFPPPRPLDWMRGNPGADVNIIVYCDFQAQPCAQFALVMAQSLIDFPGQVRWIYRHYPLILVNDKAQLAVQAAEAAGKQGFFWDMHDVLYTRQTEWSSLSSQDFRNWLSQQAESLGMNVAQFTADLDSAVVIQTAQQAWEVNSQIGIPGTPFILLNGQIWPSELPLNYYSVRNYIRLALLEKRQFETCPPMVIEGGKSYSAVITTEKGEIVVQLFPELAPIAVNNFVFLAKNGWYNGVRFHRVLEGYIAQSGDPSDSGYGNPGYAFIDEITPELTFDRAGRVAMANSGKDTNGSQFFITMAPAPQLNGGYTIFGQVLQGMEIVQKLTLRDPEQFPPPPPGDLILTIQILEQ